MHKSQVALMTGCVVQDSNRIEGDQLPVELQFPLKPLYNNH